MAIITFENLKETLLPARSDMHLLRKIWHIGTGLSAIILYQTGAFPQKTWAYIALSVALLGFLADFLRLKYAGFNALIIKAFALFLRESEKSGYSGLPFYALGCGLSLLFFNEDVAMLSILFLVFADPISSYFGVKYGQDKILPNKSLQGSTAGFCVCYLITLVYGIVNFGVSADLLAFSLLAGLVGALSELFSIYVDDNLTIPVLSGAGISFLNLFFQII